MGNPKSKTHFALTPQQQTAQDMLLSQARRGQQPFAGSFDITPASLASLQNQMGSDDPFNLNQFGMEELMREMMGTGAPVDQTASFAAQRKVAEEAAQRAVENVLARSGQAGVRYGSPTMGAAAREGASVAAQAEANILSQVAQAQEQAQQRRIQAAQLTAGIQQSAMALNVDMAKIEMAAKQFEQGMRYEEFKRMYPDVYQLLLSVWGRNVDMVLEQAPDRLGQILGFVGPILGAAVGGATGAGVLAGLITAGGR